MWNGLFPSTPSFTLILLMIVMPTPCRNAEKRRNSNLAPESRSTFLRQLLRGYDRSTPPLVDPENAVSVTMDVNHIRLSPDKQSMYLDIYLKEDWQDPRLAYDPADVGEKSQIRLASAWSKIWLPDVFISNAFLVEDFELPIEQRMVTLSSSGHMQFVMRLAVTTYCVELASVVIQRPTCLFTFESWSYTAEEMKLQWSAKPLRFDKDATINSYALEHYAFFECTSSNAAGRQCMGIKLHFKQIYEV